MDQYNHIFAFWKESSTTIKEAFYNGGRWAGATPLTHANAGSEPAVTIDPGLNTGGTNPSNDQFLFWIGNGSDHNLTYAYRGTGGWHGPYDIGMGNLGSGEFAPSATWYQVSGKYELIVAWTSFGTGASISYTQSTDPANPSSWSAPTKARYANINPNYEPALAGNADVSAAGTWLDAGDVVSLWTGTMPPANNGNKLTGKPLGSAPTAVTFASVDCECQILSDYWEGTSGGIYGLTYSIAGNSGVEEYYAGQLGSQPAVTMPIQTDTSANTTWYWICANDKNLCQYDGLVGKVKDLGFGPIPSP